MFFVGTKSWGTSRLKRGFMVYQLLKLRTPMNFTCVVDVDFSKRHLCSSRDEINSKFVVSTLKNKVNLSSQHLKMKTKLIKNRYVNVKEALKSKVKVIRRENIWTVPNILCLARIAVCPYLGYLITMQADYATSLHIFVLAGLSDVIDGYIARNYKNQSSVLGSMLDPLADKILIGTIYISLANVGIVPVALTAVVLGRDTLLTSAGAYLRYKSLPNPKTWSDFFDPSLPTVRLKPLKISKFNTVVQILTATISLAIPAYDLDLGDFVLGLWALNGLTTVASFVCYVVSSSKAYKLLKISERKTISSSK